MVIKKHFCVYWLIFELFLGSVFFFCLFMSVCKSIDKKFKNKQYLGLMFAAAALHDSSLLI